MNETEKPFACSVKGCEMKFTNEDHLNWHQKKHDMMLNLGLTKNNEVADQTPTPTRFIRNCEEVGLFQDLQNVNPFDEIFQKAVEQVKTGVALEVPEANSDETLHTPHILPHIEENEEKCDSPKISTSDNSHSNDFITNRVISINPESNSVSNGLPITTKEFVSNNVKRKIKEALEKREKHGRKSDVKKEFISVIPIYDLTKKKEDDENTRNSAKNLSNPVINASRQKIREMNRAAQMRCRKRKQLRWMEMEEELHLLREHNKRLKLENYNLRMLLKELQDKGQNAINNNLRNQLESLTEDVPDSSSSNPIFIQVLPGKLGIGLPVTSVPSTSNVKLEESIITHKKSVVLETGPGTILRLQTIQPPFLLLVSFLLFSTSFTANAANLPKKTSEPEVASDVRVECNSDEIVVSISTRSGRFNGMIYPRGLSKNSSCLGEWVHRKAPITYNLPLRGCNTMSTELDDGGIEYFNTIVVQPHLKLVTNQGRGFHIRCRYNTRNNTILNDSLKVDLTSADTLSALAPMPGCNMKIFSGDPTQKEVAENVKIGDPLTLVVSLDEQDTYGIRVTDCLVRDGLGWGEQKLVDDDGCPTDMEIMGMFKYSNDHTKASVHFQAHKFPYTASVYYQCNVKLCLKADNGCEVVEPSCGTNRVRRQAPSEPGEGTPATIEVYSGLYVNEANDLAKAGQEDDSVYSEKTSDSICISQRSFAIGICIAGLILMLCVIIAILFLLAKRRRKTTSNPGSSIYSGPYTNTAYSHSS